MPKFRLNKKTVGLILAVLFYLFIIFNYSNNRQQEIIISKNLISPTTRTSQFAKVTRVFDGDTIEIDTGQRVRYIGMNTPEVYFPNDPKKPAECFAVEAMRKNKELVEGKMVRLEKDVSETDKYKRLLRFVYLENPATTSAIFVNDFLVREGYARIDTVPPDIKFSAQFLQAQSEANENKRGLWSKCE